MGVEVYLSFFFSFFIHVNVYVQPYDYDGPRGRSLPVHGHHTATAGQSAIRLPLKLRTATQPESIACVVVPRDGISTILSWNECTRIDY